MAEFIILIIALISLALFWILMDEQNNIAFNDAFIFGVFSVIFSILIVLVLPIAFIVAVIELIRKILRG